MGAFEPKQFGRFYLLERLAVGGMAEIYKAKTYGAEGFEKLLAIKRILPHCSADKDFIRMLIDEAKLSVLLSHANIVQVYDLGKVGEDFFIAMEYINGVNLRDILYRCRDRKRTVPPELAIYMVSEICKGLDYAHRKTDHHGQPLGIVHRDVSPQNILISFEGEVKIVDFGIAKAAMNISHTMAGILKGKIAYMSPEQSLGKPVDHRTDIFSAGIILYECLTGQKLFTGESQFEVLKKIRSTKLTEQRLPESLPLPVRQLLATALTYYAKDRYQSAGDFQSDLTRHLYSAYVDFTPQRLAAFVRELFGEELQRQQQQAQARHQRQQITVSLTPLETVVPRSGAAGPSEAIAVEAASLLAPSAETREVSAPGAIPRPPERSISAIEPARRPRLRQWGLIGGVTLALVAAVGTFVRWGIPRWFGTPAATQFGTLRVASQPPGATITLDGKAMGQATPALIENLQLQQLYTITLSKPGYFDVSQRLALTSTTPVNLEMALRAAQGTLVIDSSPPGATITLNGQPSSTQTPATIPDLKLGETVRIGLDLPQHQHYETVVTIEGTEPQTIKVTLPPLQSIPVPGPAATAGGTETPPPTSTTVPASTTTEPVPTPPAAGDVAARVRVVSDPPGATILINGRSTGQHTPAVLDHLRVGKRYTIQVRKEGYSGWARTITPRSQQEITISQALTAMQPLAGPPATVSTPKPDKSTTRETPPPATTTTVDRQGGARLERSVPTGNGTVTIKSKPKGATVVIDGRSFGRTPLTVRGLKGGTNHSVRVELSGYRPWQSAVRLEDGQEQVVNAPLEKAE